MMYYVFNIKNNILYFIYEILSKIYKISDIKMLHVLILYFIFNIIYNIYNVI